MALRKTILATGYTYHILNRTTFGVPLFRNKRDYDIFLEAARFYLQPKPPVKFSLYRHSKNKYSPDLTKSLVDIVTYCLMPNHVHFILTHREDKGIKKFIQRLTNSYAHYFQLKYKQKGHLFEGNFKAIHVSTEEQLVHLSRYVHLNPVTGYLTNNPKDYPYSSYVYYSAREKLDWLKPSLILDLFKSFSDYEKFVLAQKGYQRQLAKIQHLLLEE